MMLEDDGTSSSEYPRKTYRDRDKNDMESSGLSCEDAQHLMHKLRWKIVKIIFVCVSWGTPATTLLHTQSII